MEDISANEFEVNWPNGYQETWDGFLKCKVTWKQAVDTALVPFYNKEHTAMEIGCGGGRWTCWHLAPNFKKVIALDVVSLKFEKPENVEYIQVPSRNFECFGVDDSGIDYTWCFGVFPHLSMPACDAYLRSIFRKMKPGGNVICHFANSDRCYNDHGWFSSPTLKEAQRSVESAGFTEFVDLFPTFRDTLAHFKKPI